VFRRNKIGWVWHGTANRVAWRGRYHYPFGVIPKGNRSGSVRPNVVARDYISGRGTVCDLYSILKIARDEVVLGRGRPPDQVVTASSDEDSVGAIPQCRSSGLCQSDKIALDNIALRPAPE